MEKLKNENDLKNINGGSMLTKEEAKPHMGPKVDKYNVVVGNRYVAYCHDTISPCVAIAGICTKTYEKGSTYGGTTRHHILVSDDGKENDIDGDSYTMYEYI